MSDSVFFINRPNQAHNFIKVKEKIMNCLNKELKDEGAMGKALEEGKQFDETKPTLWKLDSNGDPEKDSKGNFIEDKIDKSSIRGCEFMQDCADWRKRREKHKQNKVVASAIILGQCSKNVVTKLEANVDWDSIRHEPIDLLAAIQAITQNSEDEKCHTHTVLTLMQKSVNAQQLENENLAAFAQRFKTIVDLFETKFGGALVKLQELRHWSPHQAN